MFEEIPDWSSVYGLWEHSVLRIHTAVDSIPTIKQVPVIRVDDWWFDSWFGTYSGYDWKPVEDVENYIDQLYHHFDSLVGRERPTNKGTKRTLELLMKAPDAETRAAIWIAATTFEFLRWNIGRGRLIHNIHESAYRHLREVFQDEYEIWHHAMKDLVPDIVLPGSLTNVLAIPDSGLVMDLIVANTVMLKQTHQVLQYVVVDKGEEK